MTIAERIRNDFKNEFENEFDFETFDAFVEDRLRRFGSVDIGIRSDSEFKSYLHTKEQVLKSNSKWLAFAKDYDCYVWTTNCQIPQKFVDLVISHLQKQGLYTSKNGACGYDTYNVISVTL